MSQPDVDSELVCQFYQAIVSEDTETVRKLMVGNRNLTCIKKKSNEVNLPEYRFDTSYELDGYKLLGAYFGPLSGLHLSLLIGNLTVVQDIIDFTFDKDLHLTFGDNNTTLHLAAFLENVEVVHKLLQRGGDPTQKNGKGFTPIDVANNESVLKALKGN